MLKDIARASEVVYRPWRPRHESLRQRERGNERKGKVAGLDLCNLLFLPIQGASEAKERIETRRK